MLSRVVRPLLLTCVGLALSTAPALAQTDGVFAVGGSISMKGGAADGTIGHVNPGLLWRFGHGGNGWGWQYGLSWYSADLEQPLEGAPAEFGELRIRPFLGGYGYSRRFGRTIATAKLLGGYAFNSFDLLPAYNDGYRTSFGATTVTADVSNTFVLKPEISAWVDVGRKVGLNISIGYMIARPDVTVTSSLGQDRRNIRADMLMFKVGAAYSVF